MQPRNYKQAHHVCTLPSSTSSRHTNQYAGTSCGNICVAATCLINYSPSFKTCIAQMNTHCWTGTSKQVYSQSLVWIKAAPSPLCFFQSTWTMSTMWLRGCRARSRASLLISLCQSCCLQTRPFSFVQCPRPTADHAQQAQSLCDREFAKIWCALTPGLMGLLCDKSINLNTAADAALRSFMAGTFRVKNLSKKTAN